MGWRGLRGLFLACFERTVSPVDRALVTQQPRQRIEIRPRSQPQNIPTLPAFETGITTPPPPPMNTPSSPPPAALSNPTPIPLLFGEGLIRHRPVISSFFSV
ncbi:unnamed protein product [Gadus morhua 'NCC']